MNGLRIRVRGQVQGVGFRPFVYQLAHLHHLTGDVRNDREGVLITVFGAQTGLFMRALQSEAPPLSRIDAVETALIQGPAPDAFVIAPSGPSGAETRVSPDAATCLDCREEIFNAGRREGYAFTNCTNCGPRFTILSGLPYDRSQTSMASFEMCSECRADYENPLDRRFHAQPIACPVCGPQLRIEPPDPHPLNAAARRLIAGEIVAIKGLGGFHIACDATNADAIARLRARKRRPGKPLALMATLAMVKDYASPNKTEIATLEQSTAPIVLIAGLGDLPQGLAPGMDALGWMLPYTPLHHLLLAQVERPLVMTSGNLSGEPQVIGNTEATEKLDQVSDAILMHDRDIARRLDDSVVRETAHGPMILRRARGLVPGTLPLPPGFEGAPDVVAYGAHLKSAICLTKNGQALLSHHLGDLDDPLTWEEFVKADADYGALFAHQPQLAACDLHPEYRSSRHAAQTGLPVTTVQHHHAHLASCLAENMWPRDGGPVAGIILDGLGLGTDGTVWGGEVLVGDYAGFRRHAWLRPAPLPGGDMASREPWRNLMARLDQAGMSGTADKMLADKPRDLLRQSIAAQTNAPLSSSAGRLFDAMSAWLGLVPHQQSFEGEAAMLLEVTARRSGPVPPLGLKINNGEIDPSPVFLNTQDGVAQSAMRFHATLAEAFAQQARALFENNEVRAVALSGGCFQNVLLLDLTLKALEGLPVMIQTKVPANDGGLALGQAVIAIAQVEVN